MNCVDQGPLQVPCPDRGSGTLHVDETTRLRSVGTWNLITSVVGFHACMVLGGGIGNHGRAPGMSWSCGRSRVSSSDSTQQEFASVQRRPSWPQPVLAAQKRHQRRDSGVGADRGQGRARPQGHRTGHPGTAGRARDPKARFRRCSPSWPATASRELRQHGDVGSDRPRLYSTRAGRHRSRRRPGSTTASPKSPSPPHHFKPPEGVTNTIALLRACCCLAGASLPAPDHPVDHHPAAPRRGHHPGDRHGLLSGRTTSNRAATTDHPPDGVDKHMQAARDGGLGARSRPRARRRPSMRQPGLSSRTEQTASNLQLHPSAMDEFSKTVEKLGRLGPRGQRPASTASQRAVAAARRWKAWSHNADISRGLAPQMVRHHWVIDGIAFQTNILALTRRGAARRR